MVLLWAKQMPVNHDSQILRIMRTLLPKTHSANQRNWHSSAGGEKILVGGPVSGTIGIAMIVEAGLQWNSTSLLRTCRYGG